MSAHDISESHGEACHSSVTSPVDSALTDTRLAILSRKNGNSWRDLAAQLDVPHGILHAIGTGAYEHVSWSTVRKVRVRLGLADPGEVTMTLLCPDCGSVHTGRCHGRPVVAVVILGPGERVARKTTQVMRRWADLPPRELARAIMNRVPYTEGATP